MGVSVKIILKKLVPLLNTIVAQKLQQLDGHIILSRGKYEHRYHILDLHHKTHATTIKTKDNKIVPYNKEWAFGNLILHNKDKVYFSERTTPNGNVEEYVVSSQIYSNLTSYETYDIDRNAKMVNEDNVDFVVNEILKLQKIGLIP